MVSDTEIMVALYSDSAYLGNQIQGGLGGLGLPRRVGHNAQWAPLYECQTFGFFSKAVLQLVELTGFSGVGSSD